MKLRTLIADDEPLARERLRLLLGGDAEIDIVAECRNAREAIGALRSGSIDLAFLDIEMTGPGGFDVIEQIGVDNMPLTVFVTAHNTYAVRAFEVHALDYLTKPVEPGRLQATLARIKERCTTEAQARALRDRLNGLIQGLNPELYPERLLIPSGVKSVFVVVREIEWIEAADYYAVVHVGNQSLVLRETIKQLAATLDPKRFVRIHRSAIVNIEHVKEVVRAGRCEGWVVLSGGQKVKMSQLGWESLQGTLSPGR